MSSVIRIAFATAASFLIVSVFGCTGDKSHEELRGEKEKEHGVAETQAVKPTGKKVVFNMITDSKGERYDPLEYTVQRGDSVIFALQSGVHNVHFVPDKNPAGVKLPEVGAYLQLPGQTSAYLMDFPEGRYYFQCDIHVLLGMKGYITVADDN